MEGEDAKNHGSCERKCGFYTRIGEMDSKNVLECRELSQKQRREGSRRNQQRDRQYRSVSSVAREQLEQTLEIELANVLQRLTALGLKQFRFHLAPAALELLLSEGTAMKYGARGLKRAIAQYVVNPVTRLIATDQVNTGDMLWVDRHPGGKGLAFWRDTQEPANLA